jgi:hypothetical protein
MRIEDFALAVEGEVAMSVIVKGKARLLWSDRLSLSL